MNTIASKLMTKLSLGHDTVLATIVSETGSTPRGTGAQMLVGYNGWLGGTIGGGAVEKTAIEFGQKLVVEKKSLLHEFQLRTGKDSADNLDMACGGDVTVLLQYISAEDETWRCVAEALMARINDVKGGWLVQKLDGGKPALLVPLPFAMRNHQHHNAEAFAAKGAADEGDQSKLSPRQLCRYLLNRYDNPERLAGMGARMAEMAVPDAAEKVADMVCGAI